MPELFGCSGGGPDDGLGFLHGLSDLLAVLGGVFPGILFDGPSPFFALFPGLVAPGLDAFFDGGEGSPSPKILLMCFFSYGFSPHFVEKVVERHPPEFPALILIHDLNA